MANLLRGSFFPFPSLPGSHFFVHFAAPLAEASLVPLNIKADMTSIALKLRPTDSRANEKNKWMGAEKKRNFTFSFFNFK
jgi:hypothetical protein